MKRVLLVFLTLGSGFAAGGLLAQREANAFFSSCGTQGGKVPPIQYPKPPQCTPQWYQCGCNFDGSIMWCYGCI